MSDRCVWSGNISLGVGSPRGRVLSTDNTVGHWRRHNGCNMTIRERVFAPARGGDRTRAVLHMWRNCAGARVGLLRIEGGGHTWPGGRQYLPQGTIGPTSAVDATTLIWRFFRGL